MIIFFVKNMKLTLYCSWFSEQKQPCFLFFSQGLSTKRSWTFATFASFNAYRINWTMFLVIHNIYYRFYVHWIFLCHFQCIPSSSTSHVDQGTTFGESSGACPSDLKSVPPISVCPHWLLNTSHIVFTNVTHLWFWPLCCKTWLPARQGLNMSVTL